MDIPEILVVRHGETEWNRLGRWQGDLDSPLTDLGRAQARDMGAMLACNGIGPHSHTIYSSPIGRARITAALMLDAMGAATAPVTEDARLREISVGDWTGAHRDEIRAQTGLDESANFLDYYAAAPGGEGFDAVFARSTAFLRSLQGPALIVTHGITSRFLRTIAMGWGSDRLLDLPGGQGVVHCVANRQHAEMSP
jgi:probable phosphoglycerate mutase